MNKALKKDKKKGKNYQAEYMKSHKTLCVTLSKKDDADVLEWLDTRGEKQKSNAVRKALRQAITKEQDNGNRICKY